MLDIGDKLDNTAGASGELSADEFNDPKNEIQESVEVTGQVLSQLKTPGQLGRAMFINGTSAQTFVDSSTVNQIVLTPKTGVTGLICPDAYAQMDGMIVIFDKTTATTSTAVTVNIGQTTGTLLGAKNLNSAPIGLIGQIAIRYNLSSDYWELVQINSMPDIGYIQTELNVSGTNLLIVKPKIEIEPTPGLRKLINLNTDVTIDLTALSASTWYACVAREDNQAISAVTIASLTGWTGVLGNQLNMYSIWDADRKYCRTSDGVNNYRVFGVFKTNATLTGVTSNFYIPNIPKTRMYVQRTTNLAVAAGGTTIPYDTIIYDNNSEYISPYFTSKRTIEAVVSINTFQYTTPFAGVRNTSFGFAGALRSLTTELSSSQIIDHVLSTTGTIIQNTTINVLLSGQTGTLNGDVRNNFTIHEI